jgi:hypothetical protein
MTRGSIVFIVPTRHPVNGKFSGRPLVTTLSILGRINSNRYRPEYWLYRLKI